MMHEGWKFFARVARILFRVLLWLFAIAGLLGLIVHWLRWDQKNRLPSDAGVRGVVGSPDGRYKAIIFVQDGGGGLSPYCFQRVAVVEVQTAPENSWNESSTVFEGSCIPDVDVTWISRSRLKIVFNPTLVSQGIAAARLKADAMGTKVHVTYGLK
jgi:hypothetical protein